jgi:hypothetical protein
MLTPHLLLSLERPLNCYARQGQLVQELLPMVSCRGLSSQAHQHHLMSAQSSLIHCHEAAA